MLQKTLIAVGVIVLWLNPAAAKAEPPPQDYYLQFIQSHTDLKEHAWAAPGPSQIVTDALTIEVWVKWSGFDIEELKAHPEWHGSDQTMVCGQGAYGFRYDDRDPFNSWTFFLETDQELWDFTAQWSLPINEWTHLAASYNGSIVRIYLDGVLHGEFKASGAVASGPNTYFTTLGRCCNGCDQEHAAPQGALELGLGRGFHGGLRELRLWNRVLTQEEIDNNRSEPLNGSEEGLVGYWPLNDGPGELHAANLVPGGFSLDFEADRTYLVPEWRLTNPFFVVREDLVDNVWDSLDGSADLGQALLDTRPDGDLSIVLNGAQGECIEVQTPFRALRQQGDGRLALDTGAVLMGPIPEVANSALMPVVADLNGDNNPDVFSGNSGEDWCNGLGDINTLFLSQPGGLLADASTQLMGHPCTLEEPGFVGQHRCTDGGMDGAYGRPPGPRYADTGAPPQPLPIDASADSAFGDIDGDLDIDIWVGNVGPDMPYFLINDGSGNFLADWDRGPETQYQDFESMYPQALGSLIADLDSDGHPDLVLFPWLIEGDPRGWVGGIYWNDGSGNFSAASNFPIVPTPGTPPCRWGRPYGGGKGMTAADIDADNDLDLLVPWDGGGFCSDFTLQTWINQGSRNFVDETVARFGLPPHEGFPRGHDLAGLRWVDVNQDHCSDIVFVGWRYPFDAPGSDEHNIWLNDCTGRFAPVENAVLGKPGLLLPVDIEPDGDIDFLTTRGDRMLVPGWFNDWHDFAILENVRDLPTPRIGIIQENGFEDP